MSRRSGWFLACGLLVALVLAGVVSNFASRSPDGLDATTLNGCTVDDKGNITGGQCMARQAGHQSNNGPLANYGIKGVSNPYLSTGLAGVAGVLLTFGVGAGLFWLARRRGTTTTSGTTTTGATGATTMAGTAPPQAESGD